MLTPPAVDDSLEGLAPLHEVFELVEGGAGRGQRHHVAGLRPVTGSLYGTLEGRHLQNFRVVGAIAGSLLHGGTDLPAVAPHSTSSFTCSTISGPSTSKGMCLS